ncbi:MAG: oligosaccharide flippase family protein [Candidatus Pacebacteria bacterium]|nr:oligosaccharide flippase family protein [Candidatus Paceibacterota bacterium]
MTSRIKSITQDSFLRHNFILFCGSMIVAVFNYLYHPILGRMMSVEEFGEVQALVSLFLQFGIIGGVFRIMVINITSNSSEEEAKESISALYKVALALILLISLIIVAASPLLKQFFNFHSAYPFVILALILLSGIPIIFSEAILQGRHKFKEISISQSIASIGKLLFAVFFVSWGWSSAGAIFGIIVAQFFAILYLRTKTKGLLKLERKNIEISAKIKKNVKYAFLVLTVSLTTSFLFSFDILVVKHYFSSEIAGLYGGVAIISRIVFFVTGSIVGVMLPSIKIHDQDGNNSTILRKSLILISLVGGGVLIFFAIFPEFVITLMLGERYLAYVGLLPLLSFTLFLVSVINLLFSYMLAIRNFKAAGISLLGFAIIIFLSLIHHETLLAVIQNSLITSIAIIAMLFTAKTKREMPG